MTPLEAVKFMKENKILSFKDGSLELTLHPEALFEPVDTPKKEDPKDPDLDVVGATGTSRRFQMELLGVVHEEDFKER